MVLLLKYIIALTNLYGMVNKEKVVEIYNSQNSDQVSVGDVEKYLQSPPDELEKAFVYPNEEYFVSESILEFNEFEEMLAKKANKPYYVPEQEELFKYLDDCYFEETKEYQALYNYIKKHFYDGDDYKTTMLAEDIHGNCHLKSDINYIIEEFTRRNISFKDMNQINEVVQLVMELSNSIRIWENNGYTPKELFERFDKPKLKPLPAKPFEFGGADIINLKTKAKIGRNDPCPCGSGKKYKKCCMDEV